ncbi:MAG: sigma-70 family RNA polymerase sigma factor [Gimesia sp.]|nr:sigma-70 family RNA polymerase sigma factor [Gimesia sp.]
MNRANEIWIANLSSQGPIRDQALSDLRVLLLRGLQRSFADRTDCDESFLEDTVQDTLVRILDRLSQFEGRSQFLTWATAIAIRLAMSELRRKRWRDVSLDTVVTSDGLKREWAIDSQGSQEQLAEQKAILVLLRELIQTSLTEKQKNALQAELQGIPLDEIARHLDSNRNAIYKLTHDARKRLKRGLQDAGYAQEDIQSVFAI